MNMRLNLLFIFALGLGCLKSNAQTLYGLTTKGGASGQGTLFKYDKSTNLITLIKSFSGNDGAEPSGTLLETSNGILYGTTTVGGSSDVGTLFRYDPQTEEFATLENFEYSTTGGYNFGSLIELENGDIIGVCSSGGEFDYGTIWKYSLSDNHITKLGDFNDAIGAFPYSGVMQASNEKLFGLTSNYGPGGEGSLYEFDLTTNSFGLVQAFNSNNGGYGLGELTEVNGKLFGLTFIGGENQMGTIFDYDLANNVFTTRYSFDNTNGSYPYGGKLSYAKNGLLYGTTSGGGRHEDGTLFGFNPQTGVISAVFDFNFHDSGVSYSPVIQATDGNLYGMTARNYTSGKYGFGSIFKYDIDASTYSSLSFFDNTNGANPSWTGLTEFIPVEPCLIDHTPPVVITQNITIHLDSYGKATITADLVDNGSSDNCVISSLSLSKSLFECGDVGVNEIVLTVTDGNSNVSKGVAKVTVVNDAPVITNFNVPSSPQNMSDQVEVSASVTDINLKSVSIIWGDGTTSAGVMQDETIVARHSFKSVGVFSVQVSATDLCGLKVISEGKNITVVDQTRCLTGNGKIGPSNDASHSEGDDDDDDDDDKLGEFRIDIGYRGHNKPIGTFEFGLGTDDSNSKTRSDYDHSKYNSKHSFKASSFDTLIIDGMVAQVKGVGKVNGHSGYSFLISAVDKGSHKDKLRVRIWNEGGVVYDNEMNKPIYVEASQQISSGDIRIGRCEKDEEDDDHPTDDEEDDDNDNDGCKVDSYPNPATTTYTVKVTGGAKNSTFDLVDYNGKHIDLLTRNHSSDETYSFDIGDLPPGLYLLSIRNGSQVIKKRIMKN